MSSTSGTTPKTTAPAAAAAPAANVQEFVIRVPKNLKKKHHVMRFNATLNVDFAQWKTVKMERENNLKDFRTQLDDQSQPKFGAGSEYNRDFKEEVRRKKFGIISKRYKPEAQPWILKVGGKAPTGKKFRGIREGGVGENAAFYVFTHAPDKAIEAYPLNEWYNFQPIQRYKHLSAEEAEHEFGRRKKVMNYFSLMLRKRLKGDEAEEGADDGEEKKSGGGPKGAKGKSKELKISDMDEWIDSDEDSDESGNEGKEKKEDSDDDTANKKKGKKDDKKGGKKKKKRDVDDEAFEESDDGDEEGRERDYISDSSDEPSDLELQVDKDMKGVAEEDALRKLLTSDEDSEEENQKKSDEDENKDEDSPNKEKKEGSSKDKDLQSKDKKLKSKNKLKKLKKKDDKKETSSDSSSDNNSSDSDMDEGKKKSKKKDRSASPENLKRKAGGTSLPSDLTTPDSSNSPINTPAKKLKLDATPSLPATFAGVVNSNSKDDYGITEDAVRRYLMRKPMTTTELLTKFKNKKTCVSSDKLVETMTQILKKINPVKQTIQGKMYLSIKVNK